MAQFRMPDPDEPISMRLNEPGPAAAVPGTDELQFDRAESALSSARTCVACKRATGPTYYQVQGKTVCESCANQIRAKFLTAAPAHTLLTAALYGLGAAVAGCAIYSAVAIIFHLQLALVAILVGYMVGRAVRYGSRGLGGRPQQILAALLTYFAVSASYTVILFFQSTHDLSAMILPLLLFAVAGPFLIVRSNPSAVLSLVIIGFGVWRAWKMTGWPKLEILGPYREGA